MLVLAGRLALASAALVLFAGPAVAGAAQQTEAPAPDEPASVAARADSLLASDAAGAALDLLDAELADKGPTEELSWRAAQVAVHQGMVAESSDEEAARDRYRAAESYAERRIAVDSTDARAWEWLAIARGRRTLTEGLRTRATLANGIREASSRALALDSTRAGAHHVLGMWHAEIRRLNALERLGAGAFGGDDFDQASWERAVHHLEEAARLAPDEPVHGVELAKVYLDLDRTAEAAAELRRVTALETREPGDALLRAEAEELLARVQRGGPTPSPRPDLSDREAASPRS